MRNLVFLPSLPPPQKKNSISGRNSEACRLLSPSQFLDLMLNTLFSKRTSHKSMCFRKDLFVIYGHLPLETYQQVNKVYESQYVEYFEMYLISVSDNKPAVST